MSHVQAIAESQRSRAYQPEAGRDSIAVIVEGYQRYLEYLDELEIAPLGKLNTGITVQVDGQTIKFKNDEDFADWLAEHIT
jgi:hypothetical protein